MMFLFLACMPKDNNLEEEFKQLRIETQSLQERVEALEEKNRLQEEEKQKEIKEQEAKIAEAKQRSEALEGFTEELETISTADRAEKWLPLLQKWVKTITPIHVSPATDALLAIEQDPDSLYRVIPKHGKHQGRLYAMGYRLSGIRRNSPLANLQFRNGDVLLGYNDTAIRSKEDVQSIFTSMQKEKGTLTLIRRNRLTLLLFHPPNKGEQ